MRKVQLTYKNNHDVLCDVPLDDYYEALLNDRFVELFPNLIIYFIATIHVDLDKYDGEWSQIKFINDKPFSDILSLVKLTYDTCEIQEKFLRYKKAIERERY